MTFFGSSSPYLLLETLDIAQRHANALIKNTQIGCRYREGGLTSYGRLNISQQITVIYVKSTKILSSRQSICQNLAKSCQKRLLNSIILLKRKPTIRSQLETYLFSSQIIVVFAFDPYKSLPKKGFRSTQK